MDNSSTDCHSEDPTPVSDVRQINFNKKKRLGCDWECRVIDPETGLRCGNIFEGVIAPSHRKKSCGCLRRINARKVAPIGRAKRAENARKKAAAMLDAELAKLDSAIERKTGKKA